MENRPTFEQWFSQVSSLLGIHHDINHPSNRDYDYVAAFYSGVPVPKPGDTLPSKYKGDLNSNRYVNMDGEGEFYDSKTEQIKGPQEFMVQEVRRQERDENFLNEE